MNRKSNFLVNNWILDSGAFSRISSGKGHLSVKQYAKAIMRWHKCGNLLAAVAQDYICETSVLKATKLSIVKHQQLTTWRYQRLLEELPKARPYIMPVLQGYSPEDYLNHLRQYGELLTDNAWVGVGSICKRNSRPEEVRNILTTIKTERPDLKLHGFGIKLNCLRLEGIRNLLYSADSQAHSFGLNGQRKFANANNPLSAIAYKNDLLKYCQLELKI